MRTTLNLSERLVAQLMRVHSFRSKTEAIHTAIREFIQRRRSQKLVSLFGKIHIDTDWEKLEQEELREFHRRSG